MMLNSIKVYQKDNWTEMMIHEPFFQQSVDVESAVGSLTDLSDDSDLREGVHLDTVQTVGG